MDGYVTIGTSLDTSGIEKKLDNLASMLEKKSVSAAENAASKASKRFTAGFAIGVSALSSVITKVMSGISKTIGDSISRVDTLENFPKVMGNLGISAKDAAESIDYMSEELIGLPTTLDDGAAAVQRFASANGNVKASTEMFLALNNALLAGGAPMQQQATALEQLSQAYAKGKPDMMEWRTAMTAMPAQLKQVAEAMGYVNADALGEALRNGTVSMNDFMKTLVKMNKTGINGYASLEKQAEAGTQGIGTSLVNLKTAVVKAGASILQTIGQQNIANFFKTIINVINATIPYISAFVRSFMTAVNVVVSVVSKLSNTISGLFGKKSKKDTEDMSNSVESLGFSMDGLSNNTNKATGSAKKLKKELNNLQGFDEMNILQDTSKTDTGGGEVAGGSVDLGNLGEIGNIGGALDGLNGKIKELAGSTDIFTAAVWGLVAAWAAFKLLKLINTLFDLGLSIGTIAKYAAGIGLIVGGVILIVQGVIDYLKDPTWENFMKILAGIALVVAGVALIFGGIPALITAIILLIGALALAIYKHWDEIKEFLKPIIDWIKENIIDPVVKFFQDLWDTIKKIFTPVIEFFSSIFKTAFENVKIAIDNLKQIFKGAWEGIKLIFGPVVDFFKDKFVKAFNTIKAVFEPIVHFFSLIWNKIKGTLQAFGTKVGEVIGGAFKAVINAVLTSIENILNFPVKAINKLIDVINKVPGIELTKFKTYSLPRLAKGGIINMPGNGVMVGSAIAGERGAEGVIPLTDSQQMALLGEAIGKYITINANITNTMNGRVISRELQKINNESDFAYNR